MGVRKHQKRKESNMKFHFIVGYSKKNKHYIASEEAWTLYDGGWRKEDWEEAKEEYDLDEDMKEEYEKAMEEVEWQVKSK